MYALPKLRNEANDFNAFYYPIDEYSVNVLSRRMSLLKVMVIFHCNSLFNLSDEYLVDRFYVDKIFPFRRLMSILRILKTNCFKNFEVMITQNTAVSWMYACYSIQLHVVV